MSLNADKDDGIAIPRPSPARAAGNEDAVHRGAGAPIGRALDDDDGKDGFPLTPGQIREAGKKSSKVSVAVSVLVIAAACIAMHPNFIEIIAIAAMAFLLWYVHIANTAYVEARVLRRVAARARDISAQFAVKDDEADDFERALAGLSAEVFD